MTPSRQLREIVEGLIQEAIESKTLNRNQKVFVVALLRVLKKDIKSTFADIRKLKNIKP